MLQLENRSTIEFVPFFLLFDISNSYRAMIDSLDNVPLQLSVYGEAYRLGGVASFVPSPSHCVGYIAEKQGFLFYDGLPSHNPVLKKCNMKGIHGDISLLCYFPVDVTVDDNINVPMTANDTTNMSVNGEDMAAEENKIENICNGSAVVDDSLLAKALSEPADEDENVDVKPRGHSCRYKARRVCDDVGGNTEEVKCANTAQRVRVAELVEYLHFDRDIKTLPGKEKKVLEQALV